MDIPPRIVREERDEYFKWMESRESVMDAGIMHMDIAKELKLHKR